MASRMRRGESAARAARRIIRREMKKAAEGLSRTWPVTDTAVHDARKRVKKARAALRLARDEFGERIYRRENHALRDAARPLSELRDAKILVEALDQMVRDLPPRERRAASALRSQLIATQIRVRRRALHRKQNLDPLLGILASIRRRAKSWTAGERRGSPAWQGLRRVYKAGREACAAARSEPTVDHLHEWRKQAKYLWHQLEILRPLLPRRFEKGEKRIRLLSDRLGDDHDLAVLRQRVARAPLRIAQAARNGIMRAIDRRRSALQAQARVLGARLYREKPRKRLDRIRRGMKERR